jgi:apolipoprotein N-acyltransferase
VPVLLGAPRRELRAGRPHHFNSALLVRPDGAVEHYDKRRLLPFSETRPLGALGALAVPGDLAPATYSAGSAPGLFDVDGLRVGVLICMEALDPGLAREAARAGADLLVVPSNDAWYRGRGGAAQHFAPVVFRAIETGLPVARAATTGITAVVAPDGRVVARLPQGEARVLLGPIPPAHPDPPPVLRLGDAFAHACLAVWAGAALAGWRAPRARRRLSLSASGSSPRAPSSAAGSTSA